MGIKLDVIPRKKSVGKEDAPTQCGDYPRAATRWGHQCRIYARRRSGNALGPVEGCMAAGEPPYLSPYLRSSTDTLRLSEIGTTAPLIRPQVDLGKPSHSLPSLLTEISFRHSCWKREIWRCKDKRANCSSTRTGRASGGHSVPLE